MSKNRFILTQSRGVDVLKVSNTNTFKDVYYVSCRTFCIKLVEFERHRVSF